MGCERTVTTMGDERVLRFKCEGCGRGSSIEHSETCMRGAVEALMEHPDVNVLVLADLYEREYSGPSLGALKEIAKISGECRRWSFACLTPDDCERCEPERREKLERVLDLLPGDPMRALIEIKTALRDTRTRAARGAKRCRECHAGFIERTLKPMVSSLEHAKLFGGGMGREGYGRVLQPLLRPCFMRSRLSVQPPPDGELVDAYGVGESEVRIYRLSNQLQHFYFLLPPECRLPHEHVQLLHRTRQLLLEQKTCLDPDPLRAQEQIIRASESLMAKLVIENRLKVAKEDVGGLAKHLARFTAGLGVLEALLADPRVQDIYIDAPVGRTPVHLYHQDYEECLTNVFLAPDDAESLISRFRAISGRPFSEADPVLDLNLGDIRVAAVGYPFSPGGLAFALRRRKPTPWTLPQFVRARFLTPYAAGLLSLFVDAQVSLLVTGSRGSGKTSLLGALMLELLPKFRIILVEDTLELPTEQLRELGFKVQSLRVQSAVSGVDAELCAEDALRVALRLGESVLVIGEVRSSEAKTLYEAMRVGAAGNSVMGTIHGATARDVFERVVHDLGIPPSSFKATDAIVVVAPIRPRGSVVRVRRLVQVTEVREGWREDPVAEGGFVDLMSYDQASSELRPTRALGQKSELIQGIARKWGMEPSKVMRNLEFRAEIQKALVGVAARLGRPELLEADFVVRSNLAWHGFLEEQLKRGRANYVEVLRRWRAWLHRQTGSRERESCV